ncbi:MAG: hypothetical protein V4568_01200 [Pseudomonadota bacterium]
MKLSVVISLALFLLGVLLFLIQMWFTPWSTELFIKLLVTVGAALVIVLVFSFVNKEYRESKNLKKGARLDGDEN